MANAKSFIAPLSKCSHLRTPQTQLVRPSLLPYQPVRYAATGTSANAAKYKRKEQPGAQKKKKTRSSFIQYDLRDADKFSLCDAMQYVAPWLKQLDQGLILTF